MLNLDSGVRRRRKKNSQENIQVTETENNVVKVQTDNPHLVSMGSGRLSTAVTLLPLQQGRTTIGLLEVDFKPDVVISGTGVESEHCYIENKDGVISFVPNAKQCFIDGALVTTPTRLSQGCMICLGRSNYFRFNHPREAAKIKEALPNCRVSCAPLQLFQGVDRLKAALKKTAVPSIFSWTCQGTLQKKEDRKERLLSRTNRKRKLFEDVTNDQNRPDIEPEFTAQKIDFVVNDLDMGAYEEVETETNENVTSDTETGPAFVDSTMQTDAVETEEAGIQTQKVPSFSIHNFEHDPAAVHFYTGLENYLKFMFVFDTLGPAAFHLNYIYHSVVSVSVVDQFFIVLMKLRRHEASFALSRMFGVAESVINNIVITWILFMDKQWRELDIWPSKELVKHFAPTSFKRNFPNTRVIIDGTECPVKKPKTPLAQQATFSTYKNRNTVKVLVGTTPGGLISYVSPSFGGSTSDRQIVERSALTSLCSKKDSIMADKGFNVQDIFAPFDVHINIPTFFKKKNRMSNHSVLRDRKISSKRVHVERIIGLAKTYKILVEPMNATETKLSSAIIFCCFMLCNFRNGIVPSYA